jgi:hypothetical protein
LDGLRLQWFQYQYACRLKERSDFDTEGLYC